MQQNFRLKNTVLLMALAAAYPMQAHALAGIAQFTAGEVNVRQADGRVSALTKGGDIDSGHAIVTGGNGRAQVKFTDGGLISLQPNTEFKISNYVDQNDPKQDRFLVDLLRGSMRAITGLIGKRNRDNYKLTTTTATIGIRGSGFKVGYTADGSVGITSELDKIEVCNQSGCTGLVAGESVRVINSTTPPVRTSEQAKVETPDAPKDSNAPGEKVSESGKAEVVVAVTPAPKPVVTTKTVEPVKTEPVKTEPVKTAVVAVPVSRTFTNIKVVGFGVAGSSDFAFATTSNPTTVFSDNKLLSAQDSTFNNPKWSETGTPQAEANFKSIGNVSDPNFIGWGTWTTGKYEYTGTTLLDQVHYVAGRLTPQTQITSLMLGGGTATYLLVGSTAPTRNGVAGTLNSATLTVNFTSTAYTVNSSVNTSFGVITNTATGNTPSFSGTGYMKGMFIGATGSLIGLTYAQYITSGYVAGAAVFQK